ncbi:MAG: alpha/beta fold hydrolase [Planctomycetes bacterium]|nr:alpha/beta fold hydrolase [Planctomycetota bacterium]
MDIPALNRFPRMMQEFLTCSLRENYRAHHARVMGLANRAEALAYCEEVRGKIAALFGPPPERTPLNLRVTGEIDRGSYLVRKLLFDSCPGFTVSALLYVPRGHQGPRPAVLSPCGHSWQAKAGDTYQRYSQALARMGYWVLIFDPMGQGERLQYPDGKGESLFGPGPSYPSVLEHNAMDRQLSLTGDWIGRWFVRDGIRALDVLLEQEGVDPTRVGVTGVSGGGTMSAYAVACDERITMSAPCCWVSSWHHNGINEEPVDAEQCPPGALAAGIEHSDLLLARAPNPLILLTEEQDFFDQLGSEEAFARIRHVYRLLGAEANAAYYVGPGGHGYEKGAREAMYSFFNRHAGVAATSPEAELILEEPALLCCTPSGQVSDLPGAKCVPAFTAARSRKLTCERGSPCGAELRRRVESLLKLPPRKGPPDYRILRPWNERGYARPHANHYLLESDPAHGAQVIVTKLENERRSARPGRCSSPALLYLPHHSSDRELREDERIRAMAPANPAFFACDFRGIGESRPDTCRPDSYFGLYGSDYHYASCASLLGESVVAWRVHDVLCTLDWMASFGYEPVHLVAQGWGTVPGALVALLDERVRQVTLIGALESFAGLAEAALQQWPLSALLPGVLAQFDLPDLYRGLAGKDLRLIEPRKTS